MKKTPLLLLAMLATLFSTAQGMYGFTEVVEAPGMTKDQLYINARQYLSRAFISAKDVTQIADKETGEIVMKAKLPFNLKYNYLGSERTQKSICRFRFSIYVKDGKYKYEITDFTDVTDYDNPSNKVFDYVDTSQTTTQKIWGVKQSRMDKLYQSTKEGINAEIQPMVSLLKKSMISTSTIDF